MVAVFLARYAYSFFFILVGFSCFLEASNPHTARQKTHYKVLGLEQTATADAIKQAYKKLALKWHPDRNPGNEAEATTKFQEIAAAYETLSDDARRKAYDETLEPIDPFVNPFTTPYAPGAPMWGGFAHGKPFSSTSGGTSHQGFGHNTQNQDSGPHQAGTRPASSPKTFFMSNRKLIAGVFVAGIASWYIYRRMQDDGQPARVPKFVRTTA